MKIILGVFWTESMETLRDELGATEYSMAWQRLNCGDHYEHNGLLQNVNWACSEATEIIFDLTYVELDVTNHSFVESVSVNELHLVISTPEYLSKARFFINGIEQNKQEIVDKFIFQEYWNKYL